MGDCVYCGKPARLFETRHPDCHPRLIDDRRWCSRRRLEERRKRTLPVAGEWRRAERRRPDERRRGRERRAPAWSGPRPLGV